MTKNKSFWGILLLILALNGCGDDSSTQNPLVPVNSSSEDVDFSSSSEEQFSNSEASSSNSVHPSSSPESSFSNMKRSSSNLETSSSSMMPSSSSLEETSSSMTPSSSSLGETSSSMTPSSSSLGESSSSMTPSSSSPEETSSSMTPSSSSLEESSSSSEPSSSSQETIFNGVYDCSEYDCVTTEYLNKDIEYGEFLDERDNQVYRTIQIGEQTWLAQNLNYEIENSFCQLYQNVSFCSKFGRLYDWESAQIVCPTGWKLPSESDYEELTEYVEKNSNGIAVGKSLKSKYNKYGVGKDIWGFSGVLSGYKYKYGGASYNMEGFYWTTEEYEKDRNKAFARGLWDDEDFLGWHIFEKYDYVSVRCIRE